MRELGGIAQPAHDSNGCQCDVKTQPYTYNAVVAASAVELVSARALHVPADSIDAADRPFAG